MQNSRYSSVAMLFHWTIAVLILWNVWLAWQMEDLHGPAKTAVVQLHKSIGITVLVLSVLRLGWRLTHRAPLLNPDLKAWERALARAVHWLFYVFMIGMPLTGWIMTSASPRIKVFPIRPFDLFTWPAFPWVSDLPRDQMRQIHEAFEFVHTDVLKLLFYGLFVLHVLGALKHQFIDRDGELGRMIPFLPRPGKKEAA